MKFDTFEGYPPGSLDLPQQALLTAWDCLVRYQEDLVLVGGLAIHHLTKAPATGFPGPVTMDVDFGISLAAGGGLYDSMRDILEMHGFDWDGKRFRKTLNQFDLCIDLMTEDGERVAESVIVDNGLAVTVFPGISRALSCARTVSISGTTLIGSAAKHNIRVAEVGPMLVLKINAFGGPQGRKAPKDVHDMLYVAMNYLDGTEKAIESFQTEKSAGNPGMRFALGALRRNFQDADSQGPLSCAAFRLNNRHLEKSYFDESLQIREQCVTLAKELLRD